MGNAGFISSTVLGGSWDLVTRVMNKVTILITSYTPLQLEEEPDLETLGPGSVDGS